MNKPLLRSNDMPSSNAISGVTSQGASEQAVTTDAAARVQPATALPWEWGWRSYDVDAPGSVYSEKLKGHCYAVAMCPRYGKPNFKRDAGYIVHACNAYPRLVTALRYYAIPGMGDNGDKARAILRELGEI
jgi:hypothetical protein